MTVPQVQVSTYYRYIGPQVRTWERLKGQVAKAPEVLAGCCAAEAPEAAPHIHEAMVRAQARVLANSHGSAGAAVVYTYIYIYTYTHTSIYVYVFVDAYTHMYIYVYAYVCMHAYS